MKEFTDLYNQNHEALDKIKSTQLYQDLISGDKSAAEKIQEIYENELKDNQELILKYIEKAKEEGTKVELQGYSLGGGIQLAAYSSLCVENPELEEYIASVTVFNPYISFVEENPLNRTDDDGGSGENGPLIQYLANSDKVRIYSNEEDYVSTFNNCVFTLLDKYCFIDSVDLYEHASIHNITDIYGIVIGGGSNHGFGVINYDSFEDGNIVSPGTFYAIDESMSSTSDDDSYGFHLWCEVDDHVHGEEHEYALNYPQIIENTLKLEDIRAKIEDKGPAVEALFDEVLKYIENNVGDYNYDDFANAIADGCWEAILAGAAELTGESSVLTAVLSAIINNGTKKDAFKQGIIDFLHDPDNMEILLGAINAILDGDTEGAKRYLTALLDSLDYYIRFDLALDLTSDDGFSLMNTGSYLSYLITDFLRKKFIDKIREAVDEL